MKKFVSILLLVLMALAVFAPLALAEEGVAEAITADSTSYTNYYGMAVLGCGLAIGLAGLGTGIGMGHGLGRACEGVARNPGVMNKIMTTLIVGLALIESLAIYALVVVLIIMFVKPFGI